MQESFKYPFLPVLPGNSNRTAKLAHRHPFPRGDCKPITRGYYSRSGSQPRATCTGSAILEAGREQSGAVRRARWKVARSDVVEGSKFGERRCNDEPRDLLWGNISTSKVETNADVHQQRRLKTQGSIGNRLMKDLRLRRQQLVNEYTQYNVSPDLCKL